MMTDKHQEGYRLHQKATSDHDDNEKDYSKIT